MAVQGRNKPRNYKKEAKYDSQPHVKKKRANRNLARRRAKVVSASKNRSYARTKNARKRNPYA